MWQKIQYSSSRLYKVENNSKQQKHFFNEWFPSWVHIQYQKYKSGRKNIMSVVLSKAVTVLVYSKHKRYNLTLPIIPKLKIASRPWHFNTHFNTHFTNISAGVSNSGCPKILASKPRIKSERGASLGTKTQNNPLTIKSSNVNL